jgi:hypothetical protein
MSKKNKTFKNHIEVEKVKKLPHCLGKKCNRFMMFRESCPLDNCFHLSEADKKKNAIENLAKILSEIQED